MLNALKTSELCVPCAWSLCEVGLSPCFAYVDWQVFGPWTDKVDTDVMEVV